MMVDPRRNCVTVGAEIAVRTWRVSVVTTPAAWSTPVLKKGV